jgi:hypothetical protein
MIALPAIVVMIGMQGVIELCRMQKAEVNRLKMR